MWAQFQNLAIPLLIQLPATVSGKVVVGGSSICVAAIQGGELDEAPYSWLWCDTVSIWRGNWDGRSLSLSFSLCKKENVQATELLQLKCIRKWI